MEELLDLCQPLPGDLFARRNDDDVVHVPGVELRPEEADTKLIELVEVDVREVLGADIPEWDASLSLRRAINHFAKKPVKPKEIPVHVGVLLLELLEPLRKDFLEQVAVDGVEELPGVYFNDGHIVAPLHAGDPHVVLHLEGGADRASPVLASERSVDEHGPEDVLQLLMDDELHHLVAESRD